MTQTTIPTQAEAQAAYQAALENVTATATAARVAADAALDAQLAEAEAYKVLLRANAAAESNTYPVGTRVRHRRWAELHGTVMPSDGTGVAVQQDATGETAYGYSAEEWVKL